MSSSPLASSAKNPRISTPWPSRHYQMLCGEPEHRLGRRRDGSAEGCGSGRRVPEVARAPARPVLGPCAQEARRCQEHGIRASWAPRRGALGARRSGRPARALFGLPASSAATQLASDPVAGVRQAAAALRVVPRRTDDRQDQPAGGHGGEQLPADIAALAEEPGVQEHGVAGEGGRQLGVRERGRVGLVGAPVAEEDRRRHPSTLPRLSRSADRDGSSHRHGGQPDDLAGPSPCRSGVRVPGGNRRRRVDILLRRARIAVFVDGCFWHSCPEHCHLPKTNTSWWRLKFRGIVRRDRAPMLNSLRQAGSLSGSGA